MGTTFPQKAVFWSLRKVVAFEVWSLSRQIWKTLKAMLEIRYYVGPVQYGRGSSRSIFDNVLGRLSRRNRRWTTSADRGAGHWRTELEESYPVMGLTSLEVEWEPSYEGLKFSTHYYVDGLFYFCDFFSQDSERCSLKHCPSGVSRDYGTWTYGL